MTNMISSLTKMTAGKMSKSGEYENHEYVRLDQVLEIISMIETRIKLIQVLCGHQDASQGCRSILEVCTELEEV